MNNFRILIGVVLLIHVSTAHAFLDDLVGWIFSDPIELLDRSITELEDESSSWRAVMEETRDVLIDEGFDKLGHRVDTSVQSAIADVGIEVRCAGDFLRERVIEDLKRIRNSIHKDNKRQLKLRPRVCNPVPNEIDALQVVKGNQTTLSLTGYNLDVANLKRDRSIQAYIQESTGRKINILNYLSAASPYQMTVNLSENGIKLTPRSEKLVFEFGKHTPSSIPIVHPRPKRNRAATIKVYRECPKKIAGDREFGGNGPDVTASAWLSKNRNSVYLNYYFHLRENKSNWSEAVLQEDVEIFTAGNNQEIAYTDPPLNLRDTIEYTDKNHQPETHRGDHLVELFKTNGDTGGNDIENCNVRNHDDSYISIKFRPIDVYTQYVRYY